MHRYEQRFNAMGGPCRIQLDHPEEAPALAAMSAAETEIHRLEQRYSRYLPNSITSRINQAAGREPVVIDSETAALLDYADTLWQESNGLFDLTSGVLRQAWDFSSAKLAEQVTLEPLLALVGWEQVQRTETSVFLPRRGMELDFGGCVKEYAADSARSQLEQYGVAHALVDLAGDIATLGGQGGGEPWQIGIRDPGNNARAIASLALQGQALASSGDYERCIEIDGQRYSHILDPRSGWPVQGLAAVSVTAPQCLVAGSTATIAMLKPEQQALAWLEQVGLPWVAVNQAGELLGSELR